MTAEPSGPWVVTHPDELVGSFVIQLPDRLDLPDGTVLPSLEPLTLATLNAVAPWKDELFACRADGDTLEPLAAIVGDGRSVNYSGVALQAISMQIHHVTSDAALRYQLEPSMRVAHTIHGQPLTLDAKQQKLTQPLPVPHDVWAEVASTAAGQITLVECAVGLRLVATPPTSDDLQPLADAEPALFGSAEYEQAHPRAWHWHFVKHIDPAVLERRLDEALEFCLAELRVLQRSVHAHRRVPLQLITTELLPALVPVVLCPRGELGKPDPPMRTHFVVVRPAVDTLPPPRVYSPSDLEDLNQIRDDLPHASFTVHLDLHREACVAIQRQGNARLGALLAGMAAESLLDELLLHLMWEERRTPEEAAAQWRDGLVNRVQQEIAPRLRGPWDLKSDNPPGRWYQRVADLRNRVAHTGYTPEMDEAAKALTTVDELVTHLCNRLAHQNNLSTYPRTAIALVSNEGLQRRGALTKKVRALQDDPMEPDWAETFNRWKETWRRCRTDITGQPRRPEPARASTLLLLDEDGTEQWIIHDREAAMAATVTVDEGDPADQERLTNLRAKIPQLRVEGLRGRVSVAVAGIGYAPLGPGAAWVEEYHHIPGTEVMVDRSDHQR